MNASAEPGTHGGGSPKLLQLLAAHIGTETRNATIRDVPLNHVTVGMMLIEELRTDTGALLVPADFEVTHGFLERRRNCPPGVVDKSVRVRISSTSGVPPRQPVAATTNVRLPAAVSGG